jgi:hypothetical protein
MKHLLAIPILCSIIIIFSCNKSVDTLTKPVESSNTFQDYIIAKGQHYCQQLTIVPIAYTKLDFVVKFDSSAVYTTTQPINQYDINKLYGFSDNNAPHHQFSARVGWRWSDGALRLFAYTYNNSVVEETEISAVSIGEEHSCSITIDGPAYIFSVDGKKLTMRRESTSATAGGYKLFPYFGGDETAPHEITIRIKEK